MTVAIERDASRSLWGTMPGWGIVADLTPDELALSRQLKTLRKLIIAGLAVVLLLCLVAYGYAYYRESVASRDLDKTNATTTLLTVQQGKYTEVTRLQNVVSGIDAQVSTLMSSDIDTAKFLAEIRSALPGSMSLTSVSVTSTGTTAGGTDTAPTLDTSGRPQIGSVTLSGSAQSLNDLSTYVTSLSALRGVVNVVPSSNTVGAAGAANWTVTLKLNDELYTNKYKTPTTTGGVK